MPRTIKRQATKQKQKATPAKRHSKISTRSISRKPTIKAPIISRDVIEEILMHSAKSPEGEHLSDKALSQIAIAADLDPTKVLGAHERLCAEADESGFMTVFRVELWGPYD